jgi:hypothetical protein
MANYNPWKLKPAGQWHSRSRTERLGHVLYPHLSDAATQAEMIKLAALEGKQGGLVKRIQSGTEKVRNPWGLRRSK